MKRIVLLLSLAFLVPASAEIAPLPPGGVDWHYDHDGLVITWEPAQMTGDSPLDTYRVYYTIEGVKFPPDSVDAGQTSYRWGPLSDGSVYTFWITTVNTNGDESPPSTPLVFAGGTEYPYCTFLPINTNPPQAPQPAPGCLLPPPS